jgi:hypothetical protein
VQRPAKSKKERKDHHHVPKTEVIVGVIVNNSLISKNGDAQLENRKG